jgi:glycine dehydrogenase
MPQVPGSEMSDPFPRHDTFAARHLGPRERDLPSMLQTLGMESLDALMSRCVPSQIRSERELGIGEALTEHACLEELQAYADQNQVWRSYLGLGYADSIMPGVIQRNIFENPGWYTSYTPYQAEISQGRMEALLNYQTMVLELTQMQVANGSMLDEGTAAAEAMTLCRRVLGRKGEGRKRFVAAPGVHPQTLAILETRAEPLGIEILVADPETCKFGDDVFGVLIQYPDTSGEARPLQDTIARIHDAGALAVVATDLLALTLLEAPGSCGADIVVGNSQRFGVPLGYGGPHAAFFAAREEYKRQMPGRIVGVSVDRMAARRCALRCDTRAAHSPREGHEQHLHRAGAARDPRFDVRRVSRPRGSTPHRRPCASHDARPRGRAREARTRAARSCAFFDTLRVTPQTRQGVGARTCGAAQDQLARVRGRKPGHLSRRNRGDPRPPRRVRLLWRRRRAARPGLAAPAYPEGLARKTEILTHPIFDSYHAETELLRYIHRLQSKDLSLTGTMIPLGSCTMKLNATSEMVPVGWPGFSKLHPFAPIDQAQGYVAMNERMESMLSDITGFAATSLQPNAGSQGEYSGLLVIRAYHRAHGQEQRDICLIPSSAHGTNPASATMAGMRVVVVACDEHGNIDVQDLRKKAEEHREHLAALMVTYPSTHGVFESAIKDICAVVHEHGGQVYMDGANLNAQIGYMSPGELGADVCHLNLHKTFSIPHGGGGPGVGPIGVAKHLAPFLPGHPLVQVGGEHGIGAVSAAPWGSASILPISYAYIRMMGSQGLKQATEYAILGANYIAKRLEGHFDVLYKGEQGLVAHECILDVRPLEKTAGVTVADVAKRLMDFGFHAPTMSFPVAGTLMVEPTESESKEELDRFCDAMIAIREEIRAIERGDMDKTDNPLKNAPHCAEDVMTEAWPHPYSREQAAYPSDFTRRVWKYWPPVGRVDDVHGDRNLVCSCPPLESYQAAEEVS